MSLRVIGNISLECINPSVLGGRSIVASYYKAKYCPNYYNYLTHEKDRDVYIRYGYGCDRARMFLNEF